VKDFDVYTFYARHDVGEFPPRWRIVRQFDRAPFRGRSVDLIGRSLRDGVGADPLDALRRYMSRPRTATAQALSPKAVVLLDPEQLRGTVAWPV
jgi:hypothetical protein